MEFLPNMKTRAITANRPVDQNVDEIPSFPSMISWNGFAQKSSQNNNTGFHPQTQSTTVTWNPNLNNTEAT